MSQPTPPAPEKNHGPVCIGLDAGCPDCIRLQKEAIEASARPLPDADLEEPSAATAAVSALFGAPAPAAAAAAPQPAPAAVEKLIELAESSESLGAELASLRTELERIKLQHAEALELRNTIDADAETAALRRELAEVTADRDGLDARLTQWETGQLASDRVNDPTTIASLTALARSLRTESRRWNTYLDMVISELDSIGTDRARAIAPELAERLLLPTLTIELRRLQGIAARANDAEPICQLRERVAQLPAGPCVESVETPGRCCWCERLMRAPDGAAVTEH